MVGLVFLKRKVNLKQNLCLVALKRTIYLDSGKSRIETYFQIVSLPDF